MKGSEMSLTSTEIDLAYRLILEREPSETEVAHVAAQYDDLMTLRRAFLNSEEFGRKYNRMRATADAQMPPVLVHLHLPKTAGTSLAEALSAEPALQPNAMYHDDNLDELRALPRPERRKLRYVRGHLSMGAGEALGVPYRYLCMLRRPGPRIFSFYQFVRRTRTHPAHALLNEQNMSFGDYLEYSVGAVNHRLELDNGQMRRLSGEFRHASLGQETRLLRLALHKVLAPDVILGMVERIDQLIERLVAEGYLSSTDVKRVNISPNPDLYESAVASLTDDQRLIFDSYIGWDSYFYDVCEALLFPPGGE
jgi:hypothetical protein